jgi:hypothetical protein
MGLWLKCPGCQADNPLYAQVCSQCGQSLENLPLKQRVYVVGPGGPAAPKPPAPGPAAAEAAKPAAPPSEAGPKAEKKPKQPKKKKSQP